MQDVAPRAFPGWPQGPLTRGLLHGLLAGIAGAVAISSALPWGIVLLFGQVFALIVLAAVPIALAGLLIALSWWLSGRPRAMVNAAIVLVAGAVTVAVLGASGQLPAVLVVGRDLTPLVGGATVAALTLILHAGWLRVAGLAAALAVTAVVAAPFISAQAERSRTEAAEDETEYRAAMGRVVHPYVAPGLTVLMVKLERDDAEVRLAETGLAGAEQTLIRTERLYTLDDLDGQACGPALDPNVGGDPNGVCIKTGEDTWQLEVDGLPVVVRARGDRLVRISGAGDLAALAPVLEPLNSDSFQNAFRTQWERDAAA